MKYLLLWLLMLVACIAANGAPLPVANGGFEEGVGDWSLIKPEGFRHGSMSTVNDGAHAGNNAMHLVNEAGDGKVLRGLTHSKAIKLPDDFRTLSVHGGGLRNHNP